MFRALPCPRRVLLHNHFTRRLNGPVADSLVHVRFKGTTPRAPRADLASIPMALRQLLPELPKYDESDPFTPQRKKRFFRFYLLLLIPILLWGQWELHSDPRPLIEKKRRRSLIERLTELQEKTTTLPTTTNFSSAPVVAVLSYSQWLVNTFVPPHILRHTQSDRVFELLAAECPEDLLKSLREAAMLSYSSATEPCEGEAAQLKRAEDLFTLADLVLRQCYQAVHEQLPARQTKEIDSAPSAPW